MRRDGEPVAFANLWPSAGREEVAVDLMRFSPDAPPGAMDFLFVELMLWARQQGFGWFSLGVAPLAGLERHPLAPAWHRIGNFIFRHGEHFYNFEGLRRYKAKFHPTWEPKYLVAPGGRRPAADPGRCVGADRRRHQGTFRQIAALHKTPRA